MKKIWVFALLLLWTSRIFSQSVLSLEEAIDIALKNNYDILIAHNDADVAHINNSWGAAGWLPTIGINATDAYSNNNIRQKLSSGAEIKSNNAGSNTLSVGPVVTWTLFDGGKVFLTKKRLGQQQVLSEIQLKDKVQQLVYDVVTAYYDVVRQQQQMTALQEVISYNTERVKIYDTRFNAGLSPKTDLLQAKVDLNTNLQSVIAQRSIITAAKRKLNQLMIRDADVPMTVSDTIKMVDISKKREQAAQLYAANTSILSQQKQVDVAESVLKESKALRWPKITLNAGYNYTRSDNAAGFSLFSQTFGPQVGGGLSIPLYQAGSVYRQMAINKIQLHSAQYGLERTKLQTAIQYQNALTDYDTQRELMKLQSENTNMSKENLDITLARLKVGVSNSLESRQAELSYQTSLANLTNIQYQMKLAETKLRQLMAEF